MRKAKVNRKTNETDIEISLDIDGSGKSDIKTGLGFFDHLLSSFAKHGLFDLNIRAKGDLEVDDHHLIEDLGISLGMTFKDALKDKKKIRRFGNAKIPMDESIADIALDIDGRGFFKFNAEFGGEKIGAVSSNMIEHFFESFSRNAGITIHVSADGKNDHHKAEAIFKAFGVGLDEATGIDDRIVEIKSTKGVL